MAIDRRTLLGGLALGAAAPLARGAPQDQPQDLATLGRTPHTRFAVNVEMWWTALPFLERIDRAAELGFPAVEFWPYEGKDLAGIAKRCRDRGVAVAQFTAWGFAPGLNDPRNHADFVRKLDEACRVAKDLGAEAMTVVGGNLQPEMTLAQMHAHIAEGLKRGAPVAERHGVTLILEPMNGRVDHPGHSLYGSADAVRICREVASPRVRINWDLYHMQISEGDLCGRLREGFDQLGYAQVADHPGRNEPGTGEIHYPRVLRELHALGYRGYVGLECRPLGDELAAARAVARADSW